MRWLVALPLLFVAVPAEAGPIRVEIRTDAEARAPFVVSVIGHYADFHLGHSRHWKDVPLRAGRRRFIPLGPVNPLINMGVSVSVQHPAYVTERARSKRTPLLLRPVGFETFRPRSWRSYLDEGGPIDNGGPWQPLAQILGHFQVVLDVWLPVVDGAAGDLAADDATLRGFLPLLEDLEAFAMTDAAAVRPRRFGLRGSEDDPAFQRRLAAQDLENRHEIRDLHYRIGQWLSLSRGERNEVRAMMRAMATGQGVSEQLMQPADRERVGALLERYGADRAAQREPETRASWSNPESRVAYRVRIVGARGPCATLAITTDLTGVVAADLGDMTRRVDAKFCRSDAGAWNRATS
jgi:hypothetical protein